MYYIQQVQYTQISVTNPHFISYQSHYDYILRQLINSRTNWSFNSRSFHV